MMKATYINHMGDDLTVVNAARVSFGKKKEALGYTGADGEAMRPILHDSDVKLIRYLAKHKHMSPFGHCFASFHIKAPIFVARQLFKHKVGLTENEISRRYVDSEPEFYIPEVWRGKAKNKKQGSSGILSDNEYIGEAVKSVYERAATMYDLLITKAGVAPEQARMVLPQGMFTEWFWTGSMSAWARICKLRISDDAQAESKGIAEMIDKECVKLWPISWSALRGI